LEVVFDLLLHVMHQRHGSNQNDRRNYLVRVKAGMEKNPCDATRFSLQSLVILGILPWWDPFISKETRSDDKITSD